MQYDSVERFVTQGQDALSKGPVALIFLEDTVELASTLRHHLSRGFARVVALSRAGIAIPPDLSREIDHVTVDMNRDHAVPETINRIIEAAPDIWFYFGFNAEYLFHPFCETRTVTEMLTFHTEERRDSMLAFVIDLYAGDLDQAPDAVDPDNAWLDRSGYYALQRTDRDGSPIDRQMDFFGGMRWRFEEFIPEDRRRIDRIALFRACKGLKINHDLSFNIPEYNTYACPWHHNLTAAVASFRAAKALRRNPGSRFDIHGFRWRGSEPFRWTSHQLMTLGLMEPGQWF